MTWMTEKPTIAGHYWCVFDDATSTVIRLDDCGEWFKGLSFHRPVSLLDR